jgi:hypothetical protein
LIIDVNHGSSVLVKMCRRHAARLAVLLIQELEKPCRG